MGRRIVTKQYQGTSSETKIDTYTDKLIKYIPSDIVGAWVAASGLIQGAADVPQNTLFWIAFVIGVTLTPIWTLRMTREKDKTPAKTQAIISTGAFIVWVIALGEPFSSFPFYRPVYGSLLLLLYTLIVALITPKE
ncbi:hypothetical protein ACE1AT_23735 [Pelatocladus sp. BLCC-F211]|uniref:hypothetical protein n=1 Tax=Pelatocladus sp. BLCC-F211 TaxID=3342752 RepID=UPI000B5FC91C|nr:hypothetical protein NIES4106_60040 [Fischerella sp. NIES-4106]